MNKAEIIQAILDQLRSEFENRRASSVKTRSQGNDSENKAEDKYDTRATEENYLADGLSRQALAALQSAAAYEKLPLREFAESEPVDLGALIELSYETGFSASFFVGPAAGGIEIEMDHLSFTVITPDSPLGAKLMGKSVGDRLDHPRARITKIN